MGPPLRPRQGTPATVNSTVSTSLAGRVVTGCTVDGAHNAVGKRLRVEAGGSLGVLVVPEANRVLCHCGSFRFHAKSHPMPIRYLGSPIDVRQPRVFCLATAK